MLNVHFWKQEILYWINKALNESSLICIKLTPRSSKNCKEFQRFLKHRKLSLENQHCHLKILILVINVEFLRIFLGFWDASLTINITVFILCDYNSWHNILLRHKMIMEGITSMLSLSSTYWKVEWQSSGYHLKQDFSVQLLLTYCKLPGIYLFIYLFGFLFLLYNHILFQSDRFMFMCC